MITTKHKHTAEPNGSSPDRCWMGPLVRDSNARRNPMADGNIVWDERCDCGATRTVAANGRHREMTAWTKNKTN